MGYSLKCLSQKTLSKPVFFPSILQLCYCFSTYLPPLPLPTPKPPPTPFIHFAHHLYLCTNPSYEHLRQGLCVVVCQNQYVSHCGLTEEDLEWVLSECLLLLWEEWVQLYIVSRFNPKPSESQTYTCLYLNIFVLTRLSEPVVFHLLLCWMDVLLYDLWSADGCLKMTF